MHAHTDTVYSGWTGRHQIMVPDLDEIVHAANCRFQGTDEMTSASLTWKLPYAPWALLMRCRVPKGAVLPGTAFVDVHMKIWTTEGSPIATHRIDLERKLVPQDPPTLGLCMSPLYGELDFVKLLEWRMHHAGLGVGTVHWYDREGNTDLERLVRRMTEQQGLSDTYNFAPPLSPETYDSDYLIDRGRYGDQVGSESLCDVLASSSRLTGFEISRQVLYYLHCLEQSKHTHPTKWLAFIDVDEYFLPDPFSKEGLISYIGSQNDTVSSICFDRNSLDAPGSTFASLASLSQSTTPPHGQPQGLGSGGKGNQQQFVLGSVDAFVKRTPTHSEDNRKCMHRSDRLMVPFVHWDILSRWNKPQLRVSLTDEEGSPRLLHASSRWNKGGTVSFQRTPAFDDHLAEVKEAVASILESE